MKSIRKISIEGTRERVSLGEFKDLLVPLPPSLEQQEIGKRIRQAQEFVSQTKRDLNKLRQQKSGLMHDLLTGKVPIEVEKVAEAKVEADV